MATVTRENIGELNDKLVVKVDKEDYLPSFEKSLKQYGKSANLPGFRKGMVPAGLVKKMYGQSVFTEEVLRAVEKELTRYMTDEKLEIFAQPLPLPENDPGQLDMNQPAEYSFGFEIGLKPDFQVTDLSSETVTKYKIEVTDEMVDHQLGRMQQAYGKKKDPEGGEEDENIEKAELNEEFFKLAYPGKEIQSEEELKAQIRTDIEEYWETQSANHLQHEVYHRLLDGSSIRFPETFLKKWLETGSEKPRTAEEVEKEYPSFVNQLKWTLINEKVAAEQKIEISAADIREFAKKQLFGYMGMQMMDSEQPWVEDYLNKMVQDRKFVEDTYHRLQTEKMLDWAAGQVKKEEQPISMPDFEKLLQEHQHEHHAHEHDHDHGDDHDHDHEHEHSHDHGPDQEHGHDQAPGESGHSHQPEDASQTPSGGEKE